MGNMIDIKGKQVSEDTIVEALRKHIGFEEKKKFKKIELCHLRIEVEEKHCATLSWYDENSSVCRAFPTDLREAIKGLQEALDYIENQ